MTRPVQVRDDTPVTVTMTAGQWQSLTTRVHALAAGHTPRQRVVQGRNTRLAATAPVTTVVTVRWRKPVVIAGTVIGSMAVLFTAGLALGATPTGRLILLAIAVILVLAALALAGLLKSGGAKHCGGCPGVK